MLLSCSQLQYRTAQHIFYFSLSGGAEYWCSESTPYQT